MFVLTMFKAYQEDMLYFIALCLWSTVQLEIGTNVVNLTNKDDKFGDTEKIKLTNMWANGDPRQSPGTPRASIFVSWICYVWPIVGLCQLDLQRQTNYGVGKTFTCTLLNNLCRSNKKGTNTLDLTFYVVGSDLPV